MKGQLLCDECGYTEDIDRLVPEMVGKPCATCGSSLLTQEDYDTGSKAQVVVDMMEAMGLVKSMPVGDGDLRVHAIGGGLSVTIKKIGEL